MATFATEREVPPLTVENIVKAVQPVGDIWRYDGVGHCLVGWKKRDELKVHHSSDEDGGWRAVLNYWLHNGPHRSWRRLIWALDMGRVMRGEIRAADGVRSYAEPLRDPTLTVERVTGVMEKVEDSLGVGSVLGVPDSKWAEIKENYSTEREQNCAYGEYWVNTHWGASWERLASVLYHLEEKTALEEVVGKYLQTSRDPTLTTSTIMEVMKGKEKRWNLLGLFLDIPPSKCNYIMHRYQTDIQCMQASLDYWVRTHPAPSWKMVAEALRKMGEDTLVEEVTTKYVRASEKSQQLLDRAMQDGYVNARNMTVLVNGAAGVGKTHAIAVIMNEPPPEVRHSTPCAEKPIRAISRSRVGVHGNEWRKVDENEFREMIADTAEDCATAVATQHNVVTETKKPTTPSSSTTQPTDADTHVVPQQQSDMHSTQHKSSTKETLTQLMDRSIGCRRVFEVDWVNLIDSGGQPQFHEVLPMFLRNTSTCMPVFDLSEKFSDRHNVEYYDKHGKPVGEPYKSALTNEETLRRCVRAIHSEATKGRCPNIAFLGTHRDKERTCEETRKVKNAKLLSMLSPAAREHVLYYGGGLDEVIFPFDAKHPGEEEKKIAADLRRLIIEKCSIKPEKIPLRWYGLEVALRELMEAKGRGILSKDECLDMASTFQFDEESFEAALKHLSSLNILLYYDSVLPSIVFCDSQVPLDKVTELVEQSYHLRSYQHKKSQTPTMVMDPKWLRFRNEGIVTLDILSDECTKKHYVPGLFAPTDLIKLFEHLLIVAEVDKEEYLMPSLLLVTDSQTPSSSVPPLLIYFPNGGPRFGTFCALMAYLLSHTKWKLLVRPGSPARNSITFTIRGNPGSVTMRDSQSSYFEISVNVPTAVSSMVCPAICPRIRETILAGIREAFNKLGYVDFAPEFALFCSEKGTSCPSSPHPATMNADGKLMICTENPEEVCSILTEEQQVWFGSVKPVIPPSATAASLSKQAMKPKIWDLSKVVERTQAIWKELAEHLHFEKYQVDAIQLNNSTVRDMCRDVLGKWLEGGRKREPRTWNTLLLALREMNLTELADEVAAEL